MNSGAQNNWKKFAAEFLYEQLISANKSQELPKKEARRILRNLKNTPKIKD